MLRVLRETPITIDGEDCLEVLIEDTHFFGEDACAACIYHDFEFDFGSSVSCSEVHGCSAHPSKRFIRLPLSSDL